MIGAIMRQRVTYPRHIDIHGLPTLGANIDFATLLSQAGTAAEGAAVSSITSNQGVQATANQQSVDALSAWILAHEQQIMIGAGVLGLYIVYKVLR
jgi:hypothetical protein